MVESKKKKTGKKKIAKSTKTESSKAVNSEVSVKKAVKESENKQLAWFFVFVALAFAAVLIPFFYVESTKTFSYEFIDWTIEEEGDIDVFHGRFPALNSRIHLENKRIIHHNIYLRNDPRENNVRVEGVISDFNNGGVVSISPEFDQCRGDIPRVMVDFFDFLANGIGMLQLEVATTDESVSNTTNRRLIDCSYDGPETLFVMEVGSENSVVRSSENENCYTITIAECSDLRAVEKFMSVSVRDFRQVYGEIRQP